MGCGSCVSCASLAGEPPYPTVALLVTLPHPPSPQVRNRKHVMADRPAVADAGLRGGVGCTWRWKGIIAVGGRLMWQDGDGGPAPEESIFPSVDESLSAQRGRLRALLGAHLSSQLPEGVANLSAFDIHLVSYQGTYSQNARLLPQLSNQLATALPHNPCFALLSVTAIGKGRGGCLT
jgi:hypothetical protein